MNIQQTIIEGITALLHQQDYLVLPDFGGFVLKYRPSHYSATGGQLFPPSKTVSFNAQLRQNDGSLVRWLSQRTGSELPQAEKQVQEFTGYCKGVLNSKRRLTIPAIGFFYLDFEENLCFEPETGRNFLRDSFGLGPTQIKLAVPTPIAEQKRKPQFQDRTLSKSRAKNPAGRSGKPVTGIAALALSVITFCLVVVMAAGKLNGTFYAGMFSSGETALYKPLAYEPLNLAEVSAAEPLVTDADGRTMLKFGESRLPVKRDTEAAAPDRSKPHYDIVLGCFSVPENAKKLVKELKRLNILASVSPVSQKGLTVVSFGPFESRTSALMEMPRVQQVQESAWIRQY